MQLIRNASGHCRGAFQRLVDANEIVVNEIQTQHVQVVFQLLAETVCQASEPAHPHAPGEILPLDIASSDLLRFTDYGPLFYGYYYTRTVSVRGFTATAIRIVFLDTAERTFVPKRLCVPKIRFLRICGVGRPGLAVQ